MFEHVDVDSNASNVHRKNKRLHRLLGRYAENKAVRKIHQHQRNGNSKGEDDVKIRRRLRWHLKRKVFPESSYEVWHQRKESETAFIGGASNTEEIVEADAGADADDPEDDEDDELAASAEYERFTTNSENSQYWTKTNFLIQTRGLEVLPRPLVNVGSGSRSGRANVMKHNIDNLKTLLHLNVLNRKWDTAYKIYCIMVRIPKVDLRSLWPIGIEILIHKYKDQLSSSRLLLLLLLLLLQMRLKHQMYYEWLCSFLVLYNHQPAVGSDSRREPRTISAPVWRSGSKTHTPYYVVGFLWQLVIDKEYLKLKEKIEELLLEPPYNTDGVIYFLKIILHLYETVELVNEYKTSGRYEIHTRVLELIAAMEKTHQKCEQYDFAVPRLWLKTQTEILLKHISDDGFNDIVSDKSGDSSGDSTPHTTDDIMPEENDDGWGDISSDSDSELESEGGSEVSTREREKEQTPLPEPSHYTMDEGWSEIEDDDEIEEEEEEVDQVEQDLSAVVSDGIHYGNSANETTQLELDFDFE